MKLYVASKSRHCHFWQGIRAAGLDVIASSWIDWPPNFSNEDPTAQQYAEHWRRCCEEAASCDVLLLFAQEGEQQRGSLVELGACLGAGKRAFIVTAYPWSFINHPAVTVFDRLSDAIDAIRALQAEG